MEIAVSCSASGVRFGDELESPARLLANLRSCFASTTGRLLFWREEFPLVPGEVSNVAYVEFCRSRSRYGPIAAGLATPAALIGRSTERAASVHHNVINCPHTPVVSKIDMNVGAGPDCALDSFALAVEHMSAAVENVMARALVVNNERFGRLIACRLASFNRCGRARSRHRECLFRSSCRPRTFSEGQRRNECAAGHTDDYLLHSYNSSMS